MTSEWLLVPGIIIHCSNSQRSRSNLPSYVLTSNHKVKAQQTCTNHPHLVGGRKWWLRWSTLEEVWTRTNPWAPLTPHIVLVALQLDMTPLPPPTIWSGVKRPYTILSFRFRGISSSMMSISHWRRTCHQELLDPTNLSWNNLSH